ncbi:MAG: DUF2007 domain-containing protein [Chloroflexi bacterium]|nr:DUF2007 domain-containing protein [Chloroflexota bacterium]MCI0890918.1 DUF2007 domain-containing protein [Chloroflexota bacterium]
MRWLKRFLASDDPIVKLIAVLTEPEALMRRELLENEGVPAMVKNTGALQSHLQLPFSQDFDLYVKKSDLERAAEVLGPLIDATPRDEDLSDGNGSRDGYTR